MSEMEKIQKYIERTNIPTETAENYTPNISEVSAIYTAAKKDLYHAIMLTFNYGMAKGMRAARRAKQ